MLDIPFNRSTRKYEVAHGDALVEFPAGLAGKRNAFKMTIYAASRRLYRLVDDLAKKHPALESRAWKAAEIVIEEGVNRQVDGALAIVASQSSEYGDYLIQEVDGLLACDCVDFTGHTAPFVGHSFQRLCKHILSYQIAVRLSKRQCYTCRKLVDAELLDCPDCGNPVEPF